MKLKKRLEVYNKYKGRCSYCGTKIEYKAMQIDHLFPKRFSHHFKNPESRKYFNLKGDHIDSIENLMPSCRRCNHYKRALILEEFRKLLLTLHERIKSQYINKVAIDYGIIFINSWDGVFYFEKTSKRKKGQ